jgi:hypothetical protein
MSRELRTYIGELRLSGYKVRGEKEDWRGYIWITIDERITLRVDKSPGPCHHVYLPDRWGKVRTQSFAELEDAIEVINERLRV